eukprot:scaffold412_cov118-Skeletonema_marinoi.AAC.6
MTIKRSITDADAHKIMWRAKYLARLLSSFPAAGQPPTTVCSQPLIRYHQSQQAKKPSRTALPGS